MPEINLENLNFHDDNEETKLDKFLTYFKIKLFNVQCLGLKYYMTSPSFEIISIPILLFQLLSYSFDNSVNFIFDLYSLKIY